MSSGDQPRKLTSKEIICLKNLMVNECLRRRFMTKEETVRHLACNENIDPGLTELIWEYYEKKHPDWFEEYYRRMKERRQISRNNDEADQSMHQAESCNTAMAAVQESTTLASTILKTTSDSFDTSEWFIVDSPFETNENVPQVDISEDFRLIEDYISQKNIKIQQRLADSPSHETNTDNLHDLHDEGKDEEKQDDRLGKDGLSSKGYSKNG